MEMTAFDIPSSCSTGHENAFAMARWCACQVEVFECIDRNRWDIVPMRHSARSFAAHLAKTLIRQIQLRLVLEKAQCHGVEGSIVHSLQVHESYHFVFNT